MSTHELIRKVMKAKTNWKSWEVQEKLRSMGKPYSESTVTRRMREMADVIAIPPKDRRVSTAWTYKLG